MAFNNLFGPNGFTMGGPSAMGGGPQAPQQQSQPQLGNQMSNPMPMGNQMQAQPQPAAPPSQQQEMQFYSALFQILDTDKKQALSGGQVFQFFLSSQVTKAVLADIWDAVKSNGVLQVRGFMTAMKLITLAQNGVKPDVNSLNNYQYVGPPKLQYPPNTRLLTPPGVLIKGQGGVSAHQKNASMAKPDPFSALDLGFKPATSAPAAKPSGPTWSSTETPSSATGKNTATSSPQMNGIGGGASYGGPPQMNIGAQPTGNMQSMAGTGANQYAPSTMLKQMHIRGQSTRGVLPQSHGHASDPHESDNELPQLGRVTSRRLFEDERQREELRAANQREKMARQQLNEARISNEKLERENEQLRSEIKDSRDAQANALKQSSEALQQIQPLRLENEKLKQAITEWQDLIQTKDSEFEDLAGECDELRAANEQYKNEHRDATEKLEDLKFRVESLTSKLQESESENKKHMREISKLKDEKLKAESEKRDLDIEIVKLQSNNKSLQRELAKEKDAKRKEDAMFSSYGPPPTERRSRRSTIERPPSSRSPVQRPSQSSQQAPIEQMLSSGSGSAAASKEEASSAPSQPMGDLFAGLSHDVAPIQEEQPKPKVKKPQDDEFGGGFDSTFPEFDANNPPPPAGVSNGNGNVGGGMDIGNNSIVPPGMKDADENLTGYGSGGSEYDEIEVTEMEDYEVKEKQMVTVPKEVKYMEMGEVAIPVKNSDVENGVYTGAGTYGKSQYFLTLKIFNANKGHFVKSDKDKDGKLNVKEAWAFFQMANMDPKVLQQAWKLVATQHNDPDLPKDGLSEIQFHCMFQIILTMKRHDIKDCPASIPPALEFDVIRMLGEPVNDGRVIVRKTIEKTKNEPVQEERMVTVKKQRPKKVKKRVKRGAKPGGQGQQPGAAQQKQVKKSPPMSNNVPPPADMDDGFGFGDDDAPGAGPGAQVSNTNANAPSGGDDWGGGFGDDFGTSDNTSSNNKKDKKKNDGFLDDDGFGDTNTGNTPGGDWENWGGDW